MFHKYLVLPICWFTLATSIPAAANSERVAAIQPSALQETTAWFEIPMSYLVLPSAMAATGLWFVWTDPLAWFARPAVVRHVSPRVVRQAQGYPPVWAAAGAGAAAVTVVTATSSAVTTSLAAFVAAVQEGEFCYRELFAGFVAALMESGHSLTEGQMSTLHKAIKALDHNAALNVDVHGALRSLLHYLTRNQASAPQVADLIRDTLKHGK